MDIKTFKEHFELCIKANGLRFSPGDRSAAEEIQKKTAKIKEIEEKLKDYNIKIRRMEKDPIRFRRMSLFWWVLTCVPMILLFWLHYSELGDALLIQRMTLLEIYLPSAGLLVAGMIFGYFIWIHAVLLVAAVVLTTVFPIHIFGASANWMWIYIVLGTVITVFARIGYYNKHIRKTEDWYREGQRLQKEQHAMLDEVSAMYLKAVSGPRQQLIKRFPQYKKLTECWISQAYTVNYFKRVDYVDSSHGRYGYNSTYPEYREGHYEKADRIVDWVCKISGQELGYTTLSAAQAKELVKEKNLTPLFGLSIPTFWEGLRYEGFHHKWTESRYEIIRTTETVTHAIENQRKRDLKSEMDSREIRHLGMTADWYEWKPDNSLAEQEAARKYNQWKKERLDEMPDHFYVTKERQKTDRVHSGESHDDYAFVKVTTPDGALVGIYCSDAGVEFSLKEARKYVDLTLGPLTIPYSPTQRGYLSQEFFGDGI